MMMFLIIITIISAVSSRRPIEIGSGGTREGERAAEVRAGWWYSHLWSLFTIFLVYFRFLNENEVNSDSSDDTRTFDNCLLSSWSFFGFNVKMLTEAQSSCKWLWPYLLSNHQWRAAQLCFKKTSIIEIHPTKIFRGLCFKVWNRRRQQSEVFQVKIQLNIHMKFPIN